MDKLKNDIIYKGTISYPGTIYHGNFTIINENKILLIDINEYLDLNKIPFMDIECREIKNKNNDFNSIGYLFETHNESVKEMVNLVNSYGKFVIYGINFNIKNGKITESLFPTDIIINELKSGITYSKLFDYLYFHEDKEKYLLYYNIDLDRFEIYENTIYNERTDKNGNDIIKKYRFDKYSFTLESSFNFKFTINNRIYKDYFIFKSKLEKYINDGNLIKIGIDNTKNQNKGVNRNE